MRGRSSLVVVAWIALSCVKPIEGPTAAVPSDPPRHFVDADGSGDADDEPAPAETEPTTASLVPDAVDIHVNDTYRELTDPAEWTDRFERESREVFDHRDEVLDALGLRPGMAVADVGAGTGLFTLPLAQRVGPEGRVYAVDVQSYFLDHIGQKARAAKLDNISLVRAEQDAVGLAEGSIDLAIMVDVYHHIERPAPYLASLRAALRPGGRLVVIDYRREPGVSEGWLLIHVRAGADTFRKELEGAGFEFVKEHEGILKENFFFELRRP